MTNPAAPMDRASPRRGVVLLVEDHADTRLMYAEFLSMTFEVVTAADGNDALEMLQTAPPDLVITDLSLPGLDGFQLISRIRSEPATARLPIICLSGYGGHAHEQRAREAGSDRVLQKPCMPDALTAIALDLLSASAARRDS